uniref:Phosphatidic acid phosphatase type 2/haloperoxidase domain-containing protein n=1 Tax=Trichobilharzia regenti TaxID=157069 RepID=A0AA85JRZ3_TRIRE|nr:unnamed protein product [Trichobilharzia regenti]
MQSLMTSRPQRGGYREGSMMYSNAYRPSECNRFRSTSSTDKLQGGRQTRLCFTRLQEVHTEVNCEPVSKFSDMLNVKSRPDSELCDDNGLVNKSVAATGKALLNTVSQHRVTASECSSDPTSLQGITSQSEEIKPLIICEEEPKLSTSVIKEFENDELDGKLNICDNDHDTSLLFWLIMMSVIDQRVAHLSSDDSAKPELAVKDSSGGNLAVRQLSESRTTTASDPLLSSSPCVTQSSFVFLSTMKWTSMNSRALCNDYDSIGAFEKTKDIAQLSENKTSVNERVWRCARHSTLRCLDPDKRDWWTETRNILSMACASQCSRPKLNVPLFLRAASDLLTIILLHAVYFLIKFFGSRKWSFFCDDWSIKYPYKGNTVSSLAVCLYGYLTPIVIIVTVEIGTAIFRKKTERSYSIRSSLPFIYDFCIASLMSHGVCVFLTTLTKYNLGLQTVYTCQGTREDLIHDVFLSFLSGHASTAAAGVFFSVIYLQARLQLPPLPLFRPFIQYALIASLIYVCATRVTDHYHHATDVLAGLILGFLTSVFAKVCI